MEEEFEEFEEHPQDVMEQYQQPTLLSFLTQRRFRNTVS